MNKRIKSLMLCIVMVISMLVTAVPALAAPTDACTYTVRADKTSANPGDTITFTIYMKQVGNMLGLEGTLKIPSGLTYVANSGKIIDGTKTTIGWEDLDWTEETLIFDGSGTENYTGTGEIALMEFQCTVNSDASLMNYEVSIDGALAANESGDPKDVSVIPAIVHVHKYDQTAEDSTHLKTAATCTADAVYYKSCSCGANGAATFTKTGSALGHDYSKETETDTYLKTAASKCTEHNVYWYACSRCDANAKDDAAATDKFYTGTSTGAHSFTEKIEDDAHYVAGTGTDCSSVKKYYYDCAYCDLKGTATFDSTKFGPHNYATKWSSNADKHWHECSVCHDKKDEEAHTPGAAATETTAQKCTVCDYVIKAALGHTHNLTKVPAKAATCTEAGNVEYYKCSGCSKLFSDAAGTKEITADKTAVKATGHSYEWVVDKAATETEKGSKHEECKLCGDKKASVEIPATGTTTPDSPAAGDNGMKGLWIAIIAVTLLGAGGTVIIGKKKNSFAK